MTRFKLKDCIQFIQENIEPYADEVDKTGEISENIVQAIKASGYLGSMISEEYGGMGLNNIEIGELNREWGKVCSSTRGLLTVHGMVAQAILRWGTEEQKNRFLFKLSKGEIIGAFALSEPNAGSDSNAVECIAAEQDDYYNINGTKKWITMSLIADLFLLIAKIDNKSTAFLIDAKTPGLTIHKITGLMGMRGSMIGELHFENCKVKKDAVIGGVGNGLSHVTTHSLDYGRYTVAWGSVGMCRSCLEIGRKYARERKQYSQPIYKHQLIQKLLTEMVVNYKAANLLCVKAGNLRDQGDPGSIVETMCAKYFSSKAAKLLSDNAVQIMGAVGCLEGSKVERIYRDAKILEIIEGSNQIHEIMIAINSFRV